MPQSFPPVAGPKTCILIVGSMPGEASLRAGQYYAYRQNQFWRIIFDVFEHGREPLDYEDKKAVILKHGLGLWDSLARCERKGSLDGGITRPEPNDFPALFCKYPQIRALIFNGAAAFKFYKQAFKEPQTPYRVMPSTSPAHASRTYAEKLALWRNALRGGI